jgi:hypothetical protein
MPATHIAPGLPGVSQVRADGIASIGRTQRDTPRASSGLYENGYPPNVAFGPG